MPVINQEANSYSPFHPWYYVLNGAILRPREIMHSVKESGYRGYKELYIQDANNKAEPQHSSALKKIQAEAYQELFKDLTQYRILAIDLRYYRRIRSVIQSDDNEIPVSCEHIHMNISLKHNHLYNGFAHLIWLHDLLTQQLDLFDV